jgi:hypothetical protein
MGLLEGLLLLPLAPVRGVVWIGERVYELAYQEASDPDLVRGQLAEIEEAREAGALSDDEAEELEAPLLRFLLDQQAGPGPVGG